MFEAVEEDGVIDQVKCRRAVQKTAEDWFAVVEGNKEVVKD